MILNRVITCLMHAMCELRLDQGRSSQRYIWLGNGSRCNLKIQGSTWWKNGSSKTIAQENESLFG